MRRSEPSPRRSVRACIASAAFAVALLVAATPLLAYTIFLKDGSTLQARQKYTEKGDQAIITLPSGATTTLPLSQIDIPRTNASNACCMSAAGQHPGGTDE